MNTAHSAVATRWIVSHPYVVILVTLLFCSIFPTGLGNFQLSNSARSYQGDQFVGMPIHESQGVEYVPLGLKETRRIFDEYRYGYIPKEHLSPLSIMPGHYDSTRAPDGQYALYLYHFAPRHLGIEAWDEHKQDFADAVWETFKQYFTNLDDSNIIARHIESPLDHHNHSGSMMYGDIIGLGTQLGQLLGHRPTPELANYTVPNIDGLYLAGPFMHPGGTVTLGGRATAIKMYQDMGIDLAAGFEAI